MSNQKEQSNETGVLSQDEIIDAAMREATKLNERIESALKTIIENSETLGIDQKKHLLKEAILNNDVETCRTDIESAIDEGLDKYDAYEKAIRQKAKEYGIVKAKGKDIISSRKNDFSLIYGAINFLVNCDEADEPDNINEEDYDEEGCED